LDAKSCREDSAGKLRHTVTCPRSIVYTKLPGIVQGENKKKLLEERKGSLGQWSDGRLRPSGAASWPGEGARLSTGKHAAYNVLYP
jgi:hypothetical protein